MHITCNTVVGIFFILTIDIVVVYNQNTFHRENTELYREIEDKATEDHSFVALIDIVFTDGTKRTCSGTIIHDNVVITLAHCFGTKGEDENNECDLSASSVIIRNKKMFDNGYEQYLPIERIITHPRYRGWIADLALVYAFAGKLSIKSGRIIPLTGEKTISQFNSNVTVFSWGQAIKNDGHHRLKRSDFDALIYEYYDNNLITTTTIPSDQQEYWSPIKHNVSIFPIANNVYIRKTTVEGSASRRKTINRYLYGMRRRKMESKGNKLSVEEFNMLDSFECESIIDKELKSREDYSDITNYSYEFICFTSDKNFITKEDDGAAVVHRGHLVGMTVTSVEHNGIRVAIALKIPCFCSWIADNLPGDHNDLGCCQNCCQKINKSNGRR